MDDLEQRVAELFRRAHRDACYPDCLDVQASEFARAIIPMVLEEAAKAVENQRPVHHSFVRRTHAVAAIRAIGASHDN